MACDIKTSVITRCKFDYSNPEKNDVIPGKSAVRVIHTRHEAEVKLLPNEGMHQTEPYLQIKDINDHINVNNKSSGAVCSATFQSVSH